jgi:hypothetical protein
MNFGSFCRTFLQNLANSFLRTIQHSRFHELNWLAQAGELFSDGRRFSPWMLHLGRVEKELGQVLKVLVLVVMFFAKSVSESFESAIITKCVPNALTIV